MRLFVAGGVELNIYLKMSSNRFIYEIKIKKANTRAILLYKQEDKDLVTLLAYEAFSHFAG